MSLETVVEFTLSRFCAVFSATDFLLAEMNLNFGDYLLPNPTEALESSRFPRPVAGILRRPGAPGDILKMRRSGTRKRQLNGTRFDKVGVTLRVTKAAKRGPWHSSLGE